MATAAYSLDPGALWRLMAHCATGWPGHVPSIREYTMDAQLAAAGGYDEGWRRWGAKAVALSLLIDRGERYGSIDEFEAAGRDAHELMGLPPQPPWRFRTRAVAGEDRFTDRDRRQRRTGSNHFEADFLPCSEAEHIPIEDQGVVVVGGWTCEPHSPHIEVSGPLVWGLMRSSS
jgi:hypothetical protein